jgi:hypothetical protein
MPIGSQNNGVKMGWWGTVGVLTPEKRRPYPLLIYNLTFELYLERPDECNALTSVVSYVL